MENTSWWAHGGLAALMIVIGRWIVGHVKKISMQLNGHLITYKQKNKEKKEL